jgi:hypothetical protein
MQKRPYLGWQTTLMVCIRRQHGQSGSGIAESGRRALLSGASALPFAAIQCIGNFRSKDMTTDCQFGASSNRLDVGIVGRAKGFVCCVIERKSGQRICGELAHSHSLASASASKSWALKTQKWREQSPTNGMREPHVTKWKLIAIADTYSTKQGRSDISG